VYDDASMQKILDATFFDRHTAVVARELIGKYVVRRVGRRKIALMITETEAYHGFKDKASHAIRGQTQRNAPMFDRPGTIYIYLIYGMYWMLNITCGKEKYPAAVLIRGLEGVKGPGRLAKALKIDRKLNGKKLGRANGLWIEDRGVKISPRHIAKTPRIGVSYAEEWAHKPWRFVFTQKEARGRDTLALVLIISFSDHTRSESVT